MASRSSFQVGTVYILYSGDTCLYVGQSVRPEHRLYQHLAAAYGSLITRVEYVYEGPKDRIVEQFLIRQLRPALNGSWRVKFSGLPVLDFETRDERFEKFRKYFV